MGALYEEDVAPLMFVKLTLSEEDCHCRLWVPVPPLMLDVRLTLPPMQTVVPPLMVTEGSFTTTTVWLELVA